MTAWLAGFGTQPTTSNLIRWLIQQMYGPSYIIKMISGGIIYSSVDLLQNGVRFRMFISSELTKKLGTRKSNVRVSGGRSSLLAFCGSNGGQFERAEIRNYMGRMQSHELVLRQGRLIGHCGSCMIYDPERTLISKICFTPILPNNWRGQYGIPRIG